MTGIAQDRSASAEHRGNDNLRHRMVERDEVFHASWGRRIHEWLDDPTASAGHRVVSVLADAAIKYLRDELDEDDACLFEEFFTFSALFRHKVIGYVAFMDCDDIRAMRSVPGFKVSEALWGDIQRRALRWCTFDARRAPELIAEAQRSWDAAAAGTGLPAVDVLTNRLIEETWAVRPLSNGPIGGGRSNVES